jgi:glucose/arabinose dehydrogenase
LLGLAGSTLRANFPLRRVHISKRLRQNAKSSRTFARNAKEQKGQLDKVLIDNVAAANNHDGGRVKFGPDGKLYWAWGPRKSGWRKSLRSTANSPSQSDGSVPADNPFPNSYVYSYGHRNPQGLAWQPKTGRLYATEHGPSGFQSCCRDEVNLIEPGKNYGWPEVRGDETREGMVSPVIHAGTSETWAPAGASFATRGPWRALFTGLRSDLRVQLDPNVRENGSWNGIFLAALDGCATWSKVRMETFICSPAIATGAAVRSRTTIGSFE